MYPKTGRKCSILYSLGLVHVTNIRRWDNRTNSWFLVLFRFGLGFVFFEGHLAWYPSPAWNTITLLLQSLALVYEGLEVRPRSLYMSGKHFAQ